MRQLEEADPERVTLALVRYAAWRLTRLRVGGRGLAGGVTAQDLAQEAIKKFLEGERRWNQAVYPALLNFLKGVVDSLTWNLLDSDEHRRVQPVADRERAEGAGSSGTADPDDPMARRFSTAERRPDQMLLDHIDGALAERFWLELEQEIGTVEDREIRHELLQVFQAVRHADAADYVRIAESTSLEQDRVYRRFYRLESIAARVARRLLADSNPGLRERCHAG